MCGLTLLACDNGTVDPRKFEPIAAAGQAVIRDLTDTDGIGSDNLTMLV